MNLLKVLISVLNLWRPAFCKEQAFKRAKELAIACLCAYGRKTITNMAVSLGRTEKLPVADYKFYSECKWNVEDFFDPILSTASKYIPGNYICVAADDTKTRKTGKKIPYTGWQADPMGPPFQVNLIWASRWLQFSLLLPHSTYKNDSDSTSKTVPARGLPIRFISAPHIKKPGKKATEQELEKYKELSAQHNLSTIFVKETIKLRQSMDNIGLSGKTLILSCDGSFCNKTCMAINDSRIVMVARCRKDAKLCFDAPEGSRKIYGDKKFTPEEIRQDGSIPWKTNIFFYGGQFRTIRYKEVKNVLWQNGTKRKPLRTIILAPIPYERGGKRCYRAPAYLLTTGLDIPIEVLIQSYLDRWQIEYNNRDEKSILGVGEAQLWNEVSVVKQPPFHVAVYSALLLANRIVYEDKDHIDFGPRPKWRRPPKRNSCRALVGLLRKTLLEYPSELEEMNITVPMISAILSQAA